MARSNGGTRTGETWRVHELVKIGEEKNAGFVSDITRQGRKKKEIH